MSKLIGVSAVFVPFEKRGKEWVKRDDLPRFLTSGEAVRYLMANSQRLSWRNGKPVLLEWREHSEPDLIREYADGVGTPEFNQKRYGR